MVGTILPIVYGERRAHKRPGVLWLYIVGSVGGAAALGTILGLLSALIPWLSIPFARAMLQLRAMGIISLLYSGHELSLMALPAPQCRRQVSSGWRLYSRPRLTALIYGLELGFGLSTYIITSTFYVVVLWSLLSGSAILATLAMMTFGLGRALPVVWLGRRERTSKETLRLMHALTAWEPVIHVINGLILAWAGSVILVSSLASL